MADRHEETAIVKQLHTAGDAVRCAKQQTDTARLDLAEAICKAIEADVPMSVITWHTGLTRQRIYQLRKAGKEQRANPTTPPAGDADDEDQDVG